MRLTDGPGGAKRGRLAPLMPPGGRLIPPRTPDAMALTKSDTAGEVFTRREFAASSSSRKPKAADWGGATAPPGVATEVPDWKSDCSVNSPAVSQTSTLALLGWDSMGHVHCRRVTH